MGEALNTRAKIRYRESGTGPGSAKEFHLYPVVRQAATKEEPDP